MIVRNRCGYQPDTDVQHPRSGGRSAQRAWPCPDTLSAGYGQGVCCHYPSERPTSPDTDVVSECVHRPARLEDPGTDPTRRGPFKRPLRRSHTQRGARRPVDRPSSLDTWDARLPGQRNEPVQCYQATVKNASVLTTLILAGQPSSPSSRRAPTKIIASPSRRGARKPHHHGWSGPSSLRYCRSA